MVKKVKPKNKNINFSFKFKNTIMLTILLILTVTVIFIEIIMFTYSIDSIKSIQKNMANDYFKKLSVFNPEINNSAQFEINILPPDISEASDDQYIIYKKNKIPVKNLRLTKEDWLKYKLTENSEIFDIKTVMVKKYSNGRIIDIIPTNNNYEWGNKISNSPEDLKLIASALFNAQKTTTICVKKEYSDATYYVYIVFQNNVNNYTNKIINFGRFFLTFALIISIIIAYLLAKSISKPLSEMESTISKISKGDLSGRLEYTKYYEINKLVQAYNVMANTLQKLYSSLEMQVQDRTKELNNAIKELQSTQAMMVHSEKMKSLGELVAGIMHEINNPINFIYGNMIHLSNYSNDLIKIIDEYTNYNDSLKPEQKEDIEKLKEEIDYEFLKSDMPDLIKSCKEGADRAKNIIQDLKSFSRMEEVAITDVDVAHEIDITLNILHNKLKNKAVIHKEYMDNIPKIEAFGGQLNQVFMNILDNAAGAIKETGDIWIRINTDNNNMIIQIEDNGSGMDDETVRKVFNPFFTTKPVGQGTGLGMSISYKIIKNHQGDIKVESQLNVGTKFTITLPINMDRENMNAAIINGEKNG